MKRCILVVILLLFISPKSYAQSDYLKFRPYQPYTWMVGLGWSIIDNDGGTFQFFNFMKGWDAEFYPAVISVDRYIKYGMSAELTLSFNQFRGNKTVNATSNAGIMFMTDIAFKYSAYQFISKKVSWLDPYIGVGMSFTLNTATAPHAYPTFNVPFGTNFWIDRNWGIRLQADAKFGLVPNFYFTNGNYMQYMASVLYRFQKMDRNRSNDKPRYPWVRKKPGKFKDGKSE
ncbi:MAG: hypothetical protein M9916_08615 [Crocinitomicaceae bacterium]|nr:hypothetical protein [Crocinitomicaceae bacterium]